MRAHLSTLVILAAIILLIAAVGDFGGAVIQRVAADILIKLVVVLGLSVDDPIEKLKPYATQFKINYPVLVGDGREDVQDAFGPLLGIPVSVIIGRDGVIARKHIGIGSREQFEQEVKALL